MNATNTSSTKSAMVWQATLQPSKLFAILYAIALIIALIALWQCPVHWCIRSLLIVITALGGLKIYLTTRQTASVALFEDNSWLLVENSSKTKGQLTSGCYRSMLLVVLAIKPDQGFPQYAVIWRDSVSAWDFSALHIRLALTPIQQLR